MPLKNDSWICDRCKKEFDESVAGWVYCGEEGASINCPTLCNGCIDFEMEGNNGP